jgi:serine/threonine protein kinase/tetratricopeptide (TPR) repeat protein
MPVTQHPRGEGSHSSVDQRGVLSTLLAELAREPQADLGDDWDRWLYPGATIGRFELVRELGRGGFGIVWEARDIELRRSVAFKAVRAGELSALKEEALAHEAEAIARLAHPNLVTLYDVGRSAHGPYLVLELLRGQTLAARLDRGPLPLRALLHLATEVARGLAHAHAAGVVHRDLKPANVMLTDDGQVKVLDFGLAHAFGRKRILGGTPAFMAPEQWVDAPEDERTDVFALGVILYLSLSGQLPFDGKSSESDSPRLEVQDAPEVGELVARMLSRDPIHRPRTGAAVLADLERLASLLPPPSVDLIPAVRVQRPSWGRTAALLATIAVLGVGLAYMTVLRPQMSAIAPDRSVAVLPLEDLSPEKSDELFADGIHSELINQLGRIPGLKVIARSSVLEYRGAAQDPKSIALALGVATLLEGTVRRVGNRGRITVELLDAKSGKQLWSEQYDRNLEDVLAVQSDVALQIARTLGARLSEEEIRLLRAPPTRDPQANDDFRRAVAILRESVAGGPGGEEWKRAEELLGEAIARDPSFALAIAWLSLSASTGPHLGPAQCEKAGALAERARERDPHLPEAMAASGVFRAVCTTEFRDALDQLRLAERALPNDPFLKTGIAAALWRAGDEKTAVETFRRAFDLDPRSFRSAYLFALYAGWVGAFTDAALGLARAHELSPGDLGVAARQAELAGFRDGNLEPARKVLGLALGEQRGVRSVPYEFEALARWHPPQGLKLAAQVLTHEALQPEADLLFQERWYLISGRLHFILGHREESRSAYSEALGVLSKRREWAVARGFTAQWRMSMALAKAGLGLKFEALRYLQEAEGFVYTPHGRDEFLERSAEVAVLTGDSSAALSALSELIARHRRFTAALLRVEPFYASLRSDPRFRALVEEPEPSPAVAPF